MNKEHLHTIFEHNDCLTEEQLLAYTENKLSNKERNLVERHKIDCKFCSDAVEGFEKVKNSSDSYLKLKSELTIQGNKNKKSLIPLISGIAAVILVALLIVNFPSKDNIKSAERKQTESTQEVHTSDTSEVMVEEVQVKQDSVILKSSDENSISNEKEFNQEPLTETSKNETLKEAPFKVTVKNETNDFEKEEELLEEGDFEATKTEQKIGQQLTLEKEEDLDNNKLLDLEDEAPKEIIVQDNSPVIISEENIDRATNKLIANDSLRLQEEGLAVASKTLRKEEKAKSLTSRKKAKEAETLNETKAAEQKTQLTVMVNFLYTGKEYFKIKQYENAIYNFRQISEKNPDYHEAQLFLGKCYVELKQNEKAKIHLNKALEGSKDIKIKAEQLLKQLN